MCDCLLHRDGAMNVKIDSVLNGQSGILATVFLGFMQDRVADCWQHEIQY
jgi:hypothetical protein